MERILDTSVLIKYWHHRLAKSGKSLPRIAVREAGSWGRDLAELHASRSIVTPVFIEFVAGAKSAHELKLFHAYLGQLETSDKGMISTEDWAAARSRAERVPRDSKPRHLGDCLIRAIAQRLRREVLTLDLGFPRQ